MAAQSEIATIEKLAGGDNYFFWKVMIEAMIYEKDWSEVILKASTKEQKNLEKLNGRRRTSMLSVLSFEL